MSVVVDALAAQAGLGERQQAFEHQLARETSSPSSHVKCAPMPSRAAV